MLQQTALIDGLLIPLPRRDALIASPTLLFLTTRFNKNMMTPVKPPHQRIVALASVPLASPQPPASLPLAFP